MRAGTLKHKIEIQQNDPTQDSTGAEVENWTVFDETWAAVWPVSATERLSMGKLQGEVSHKIRIRFTAGVTSAMRILFKGRVLDIMAPPINKDELNEYLDMLCREVE